MNASIKPGPLLREVTAEESKQFLRDGVICLRNIVAPEWIELAREGVEDQRRAPTPYAIVVDADPLYMLVDQAPSMVNEKLRRVAFESGVAKVARDLAARPRMRWLFDQLFYKGAGPVAETPWHQDTGYGFVNGFDLIRVWMPLDHVPRQTTIEVVRGSHLWNIEYGVATDIKVLEENKDAVKTGRFDYRDVKQDNKPAVPAIEAHRDAFDIIGYEVNPGDIVVFNYHVLHHAGAGMNPNEKRRAFAIVYADDEATLQHRPNPIPTPLDIAGVEWKDGQAVGEFPQVFPLAA